jgi:hypothetical protein
MVAGPRGHRHAAEVRFGDIQGRSSGSGLRDSAFPTPARACGGQWLDDLAVIRGIASAPNTAARPRWVWTRDFHGSVPRFPFQPRQDIREPGHLERKQRNRGGRPCQGGFGGPGASGFVRNVSELLWYPQPGGRTAVGTPFPRSSLLGVNR